MSRQVVYGVGLLCISALIVAGSLLYVGFQEEKQRVATLPFTQIVDAGEGTYTDLDGTVRSLSEYKGKRVLMVAWASWCPECGEQLALLAQSAEEAGSPLPILAVNRKEPKETALLYLATVGKRDRLTYILDTEDRVFTVSDGFAMPEFVLYEEDGSELYRARGTLMKDEMHALFETYK